MCAPFLSTGFSDYSYSTMEITRLTSASHMSLPEAGYGSEEGHVGSEISGAVSGVTTPGASRLQASQLQERSTTMQRLHGSRGRRAVSTRRDTRRWRTWSGSAVVGRLHRRSPKTIYHLRWRWGGEGRRAKESRRGQGSGAAANPVAHHRGRKERLDGADRGRADGAAGDTQKGRRQREMRGGKGRGAVRRRGAATSGN